MAKKAATNNRGGRRAKAKVIEKLPCPLCVNGQGKPHYTETGLVKHLRAFHKGATLESLAQTTPYEVQVVEPDNGHEVTPILPEVQTYKYRGLQLQQPPDEYMDMTPKWLYRKIHWEEQAKIARVKKNDLQEKLKIGAAIVVLCLFGVVLLLFGLVIIGD